jgi:RNA polymerase sigma-70 factor (ECF subfamily)
MEKIQGLWTDFHRELKGVIVKMTRNSNDADDILQDIFYKIMIHPDRIMQTDNLRQYLFAIARNAVYDHFRKRKHPAGETLLDESLPSDEAQQSINAAIAECCMRNFVNKLPEKYREAVSLTEFEDLSQKELAEKLQISYSGAKSRVQRGKEKLKELLLECCTFESDRYGNLLEADKKNCNC